MTTVIAELIGSNFWLRSPSSLPPRLRGWLRLRDFPLSQAALPCTACQCGRFGVCDVNAEMGHAGHDAQGNGRRRHEIEYLRSCRITRDREVEQTWVNDRVRLGRMRVDSAEIGVGRVGVREESTSPEGSAGDADDLRWRLDDCVGRRWDNKFKLSVSQR